jgi:hypothetical protein
MNLKQPFDRKHRYHRRKFEINFGSDMASYTSVSDWQDKSATQETHSRLAQRRTARLQNKKLDERLE